MYISHPFRVIEESTQVNDFTNQNMILIPKLLKQGNPYRSVHKAFPKLYGRHSELMSKYNVGLKTLLQDGLSEPGYHEAFIYKFYQIVDKYGGFRAFREDCQSL